MKPYYDKDKFRENERRSNNADRGIYSRRNDNNDNYWIVREQREHEDRMMPVMP